MFLMNTFAINNTRLSSPFAALTALLWALIGGAVHAQAAKPGGTVVVGSARFSVITPLCVRIEYAPSGHFIDAPSLFAADRAARFTGYTLAQTARATTIDTGTIRLTYTPDGNAPSAANMQANIRRGRAVVHWTPGAPNPGNLGGTIRTLDGVSGPVDLGQGLLSRDGWYLLDDSRSPILTSDWVQSRPVGSGTDWYLFGYGDDYKAALKSLAVIGGPVPLPRKYALGAWYSRYWAYSSADYRQIVGEYAAHDFPLDNMVLDMDWHRDGWTGWSWNRTLLPDAEQLLPWLHAQGLHDTLNLHPADGVAAHEDQYAAFMKDMGADAAAKQTLPFDAGSKKYMDALAQDVFNPLLKQGVDFWWLDWQQYPNTRSVPDLTNLAWLNVLLYRNTSQNGLRGLSFSRWAGWGDHKHPIHFSGDANTGWPMLQFEVPFTSTAGNVGCFFWSHDIGGHMGGRNEESYTRWVQFGATSPALRSHSTRSAEMDRRPWTYPKWAEDSMRVSFHLRSELFPYLYSSAWQSSHETVPLDRPLYIECPREERAYHNAQEYFFGDALLAAPIAMPGVGPGRVGRQTVWFPPGTWYNSFTGEQFRGGDEALVSADINEFPLYVRGGVPVPMQPYQARMATAPLATLRVRCYPGEDGRTGRFTLYEDDGQTTAYRTGASATTPLAYARRGNAVTVTVRPTVGHFAGQVARRSVIIELPDTGQATRATLNGRPVAVAYDAATMVNRVALPARPITQATTVVLQTKSADLTLLHTRAVARRLAGVLGRPATGASVKDMLAAALAAPALDDARREALLAAAGVGVAHKNQGAYLYHGAIKDTLYAPPGLLDAAPKTAALPSGRMLATVRVGGRTLELPADSRRAAALFGPDNVARTAKLTPSGVEGGYGVTGATDGVASGYPDDKNAEWSSGQKAGATLALAWDAPQTVNRILIFDRPNLDDQITSGTVTFSDGSTLAVGKLPDDASEGLDLRFPPKTITGLTFKVLGVKPSTQNAGLAEIAVFRAAK